MRPLRNIPSLVVFALACVLSVGWLSPARAEPANSGWMTETPHLNVEPAAANSAGASECTSKPVTYTLTDLSDVTANGGSWTKTDNLCVMEGTTVDVARNSRGTMYVRPHTDTTFRLLRGSVRARLTPGTNTYTYIDDAAVGKLWIVRNLTPALQPDETSPLGELLSYRLVPDVATPLFLDADQPGGYHHVYSYAVSRDTSTLVAYVDFIGIVKLNLTNNIAMKIAQPGGADYDTVDNPKVLAVSNDGRYVFLSSFLTLIDTIGNCGEPFVLPFSQAHPLASPCPSRNFDYIITPQIPYSFRASDASFNDTATSLSFITSSDGSPSPINDTTPRKVTLSIPTSAPLQLDYLALGDSYSSGEGDIDDNGYWYQTGTEGNSQCHLSLRSYPYLLRDMWHIDPLKMKSVACSGAKVLPDFYGGGNYYGQFSQLASMESEARTGQQNTAMSEFEPGVLRQLDFVKTYKPKVLTFTGGGNDVGFADIIRYCAQPKLLDISCGYVWNAQLSADLNHTIDDQYQYNKAFIERVKEESPETKIYMVGYPQFVSSDGKLCLENSMILDPLERAMIHNGVSRLNNILKKVARDTDIYYVDIENSLKGGEICEGSRYMTGPIKSLLTNGPSGSDPNMYHPNHEGHVKLAATIAESIANGMDYEILDIPTEQNGRKIVKRAVLPDYAGVGSTHTITVEPGMFAPNGQVTVEMFSKPVVLATERTHVDGTVNISVTIPSDIQPGYHLIQLVGTDNDRNPIVIQQFITIISHDPEDTDGDGINNQSDPCFVIDSWLIQGEDICEVSGVEEDGLSESLLKEIPMVDPIKPDVGSSVDWVVGAASKEPTPFASQTSSARSIGNSNSKEEGKNIDLKKLTFWLILAICTIIAIGTLLYREKNRKT